MTDHHVLAKKAFLLFQALLHPGRRQAALPDRLRVLAAIDVTIDVDLELDKGIKEGLEDTSPSSFINIRSLGRRETKVVVQVSQPVRRRQHLRQELVLWVFEEHLAQFRWRAEASRADGKNLHKKHVGGSKGEVMLAQWSEGSVTAEQQRAHDRLVTEETAEVTTTLFWRHDTFVPPARRFGLPTGRLGEDLTIYGGFAFVRILVV